VAPSRGVGEGELGMTTASDAWDPADTPPTHNFPVEVRLLDDSVDEARFDRVSHCWYDGTRVLVDVVAWRDRKANS
jgi:hypothetical protein